MIYIVLAIVFAFLGLYIAGEKNRSAVEGFLLGFFFGPIGTIIEVCLPTRPKPTRAQLDADDQIRELNELPLVHNENQIDQADVDRIING